MKTKKIIFSLAAIALSALASTGSVSAYVGGSSDGSVSGGGCAPAGTTSWWDTCHGATWKWYSTDSNDVYIPQAGNVSGGHIRGCKKVGGYWRYGLDHFNPSTGASYGDQAGLVQWNSVAWDSAHSDTQNINELKSIFDTYKDEFANLGYVWDQGNFSAFCGGRESSQDTTFQGHTTINVANGAKTVKSGWDQFKSDTYETDAGSIKLTFTHKIKRTDNKNTKTSVKWKLATADDGLSASLIGANNDRTIDFSATNHGTQTADSTTYTITLDPGTTKTICQGINHELTVKVSNGARTSNQPGTRGSAKACITIKRKAQPVTNASSAETGNAYIGESSSLAKSGAHTIYFYVGNSVSRPRNDQVAGGGTQNYGEGESSTPGSDDATAANNAICRNFSSLCGTYEEATSSNIIIRDDSNLVGAKICAASSSKNSIYKETRTRTKYITYTNAAGESVEEAVEESYDIYTYYWKFSDLSCSFIAKKPNFQVLGGATYSSDKITTSKSSKVADGPTKDKTYGSWSEYLAIAGDSIKNFGSGASLRGGSESSVLSKNSPLTIANESKIGYSGIFGDRFVSAIKSRFIDNNNYNHDQLNIIKLDDNADIDLTQLSADKLNIIFGKNINIPYTITAPINAWIIAEGTLNTCSGISIESLSSEGACSQPLTINGIVYAKTIKLIRTAGAWAGNNSADSAETINLTASDYIRAYQYSVKNFSQPLELYTQELAPRI